MNNNFDETKLTAYVLGELSESEAREVESRMEASEKLRKEVDQIRETVAFLQNELAGEPELKLTDQQRAKVLERSGKSGGWIFRSWYIRAAGIAATAVFLFFAVQNWTEPVIPPAGPDPLGNQEVLQTPVSEAEETLPEPAADSTPITEDRQDSSVPRAIQARGGAGEKALAEKKDIESIRRTKAEAEMPAAGLTASVAERGRPLQPAVAPAAPGEGLTAQMPVVMQAKTEPAAPAPVKESMRQGTAESAAELQSAVQVLPGKVAGVVRDQTGAAIPGAEVSLRNLQTGFRHQTLTDAAGRFELIAGPGSYRLEVRMAGFRTFTKNVEIFTGRTLALNTELQVGKMTETVRIDAAPAARAPGGVVGGVPGGVRAYVMESSSMPSAYPARDASLAAQKSIYGATVYPSADQSGGEIRIQDGEFNTEAYDRIVENPFIRVSQDPLSTFSIDVDTASYSNMRRFLNQRQLPPPDAVRIEELINYFSYEYAVPEDDKPFAVHLEAAPAPWKTDHLLVRIGLKGKPIPAGERKPSNLIFLLDVSGSMQPPNKLPLLKKAFRLLVDNLTEKDRVAIVVYAGASGLVLPSTPCARKEEILQALERLQAGGSTNGGQGIRLAYRTAQENFIPGGINRVILATDGDFNVGVTNQGDLIRLIEEKAKSGVFLTVLGFGMGNYKDSSLEKLADKGNGHYAYIDTIQEARKVLVEEIGSTLVTIAKDVKIQVEFNPGRIQAYRLIGYENRILRHQDFNDDTKDAGEIGAGHTVTALYELVPVGVEIDIPSVDPLKYQTTAQPAPEVSQELMTVKLRFKEPDGDTSRLIQFPLKQAGRSFESASRDFRFAAAVASFGMLMRDSSFKGDAGFEQVIRIAQSSLGTDTGGYRTEFVNLVKKARAIRDLESLEE